LHLNIQKAIDDLPSAAQDFGSIRQRLLEYLLKAAEFPQQVASLAPQAIDFV
jgi:hypothetical protein